MLNVLFNSYIRVHCRHMVVRMADRGWLVAGMGATIAALIVALVLVSSLGTFGGNAVVDRLVRKIDFVSMMGKINKLIQV